MKTLLMLLAMTCSFLYTQAQAVEVQQDMSQGVKNGLTMDLTETDVKTVEVSWMKFVKSYKGKSKKDRKTNEVFTDNALIKSMSANTVDIYSEAVAKGSDVKFTVWFDLGGAFLGAGSHPDAFAVAQKMLNDFSTSVSLAAVEAMLKEEETGLNKMEGDMKSLLREKLSLEEEITKCEQKIEAAKTKIEENKVAQGEKQKEIDVQTEKVKMTKEKLKKF